MKTEEYIEKQEVTDLLRESTLRSVVRALELPVGSRGLDAGCGIGRQAMLLAEAVGPGGHVTGLDVAPPIVECAKGKAETAGLSERVSFQVGDIYKLPFEADTFDWLWSTDCAGYSVSDPLPLVKELARVVKPGGRMALVFWSSQMLLPGYPLLEARLNTTVPGVAPFHAGWRPGAHYYRALGWFRELGLESPGARAFSGSVFAPLSEAFRIALTALIEMRWDGAEEELSPGDLAEYRRLCEPGSPDFILNLPDYYAFFTYSLFYAGVPK